jgi:RNA polymerase sigma factor (sigma-70 family)
MISAGSRIPGRLADGRNPLLPFGGRSTEPLSRKVERTRLEELARLRADLLNEFRGLHSAGDHDAPTHFDQWLAWWSGRSDTPATVRRRVQPLLRQYLDVRQELANANLRWVLKVAKTFVNPAVPLEDLFQEGICGLLRGIDRFEVSRDLRLMTYAHWYIREALQQARAKNAHTVCLSPHDQTLLGQLEEFRLELAHTTRKPADDQGLSVATGRSVRNLERLQTAARATISVETGTDGRGVDIPSNNPIDQFLEQEETGTVVRRLLDCLPDRERQVVVRRFGLDGHEARSLGDVGLDLHVSKERVRQLERKALEHMQEEAAKMKLTG